MKLPFDFWGTDELQLAFNEYRNTTNNLIREQGALLQDAHDKISALEQRLKDVELAYLTDPRRAQLEKEKEEAPTKGFTPFSARKRNFEIRHSTPKQT